MCVLFARNHKTALESPHHLSANNWLHIIELLELRELIIIIWHTQYNRYTTYYYRMIYESVVLFTIQSTSHHLEPSHTTSDMTCMYQNALTAARIRNQYYQSSRASERAHTHHKYKHLKSIIVVFSLWQPIFWWHVHQNHDQAASVARWHSPIDSIKSFAY